MSVLKDLKKKHKQIEVEIVKLTKKRLNDRTTGSWKSLKELKIIKIKAIIIPEIMLVTRT